PRAPCPARWRSCASGPSNARRCCSSRRARSGSTPSRCWCRRRRTPSAPGPRPSASSPPSPPPPNAPPRPELKGGSLGEAPRLLTGGAERSGAGPALRGPSQMGSEDGNEAGLLWQLPIVLPGIGRARHDTPPSAPIWVPPLRSPAPERPALLNDNARDNLERSSDGRAARRLTERGDRRGRAWRGRGGDLDAIRGRRGVPCAPVPGGPGSGAATPRQARPRPLIAAGGPTPPTGPAPESVPAPL